MSLSDNDMIDDDL